MEAVKISFSHDNSKIYPTGYKSWRVMVGRKVPPGTYYFFIYGYRMSIEVPKDRSHPFRLESDTTRREVRAPRSGLPYKNSIFVNENDVYETTKEKILKEDKQENRQLRERGLREKEEKERRSQEAKKEFFRQTIGMAEDAGLSSNQIQKILDEGNVTVLRAVSRMMFQEIHPDKATRAMSPNVNPKKMLGNTVRDMRMADIKSACRFYVRIKRGGSSRNKRYFEETLALSNKAGIPKKETWKILQQNNVTVLRTVSNMKLAKVKTSLAKKIASNGATLDEAIEMLGYSATDARRIEDIKAACREYVEL